MQLVRDSAAKNAQITVGNRPTDRHSGLKSAGFRIAWYIWEHLAKMEKLDIIYKHLYGEFIHSTNRNNSLTGLKESDDSLYYQQSAVMMTFIALSNVMANMSREKEDILVKVREIYLAFMRFRCEIVQRVKRSGISCGTYTRHRTGFSTLFSSRYIDLNLLANESVIKSNRTTIRTNRCTSVFIFQRSGYYLKSKTFSDIKINCMSNTVY